MKICEKCEGEGKFILLDDREFSCPFCKGTGKIDWLDEIIPNEDHRTRKFEKDIISFVLNKYLTDLINNTTFLK